MVTTLERCDLFKKVYIASLLHCRHFASSLVSFVNHIHDIQLANFLIHFYYFFFLSTYVTCQIKSLFHSSQKQSSRLLWVYVAHEKLSNNRYWIKEFATSFRVDFGDDQPNTGFTPPLHVYQPYFNYRFVDFCASFFSYVCLLFQQSPILLPYKIRKRRWKRYTEMNSTFE